MKTIELESKPSYPASEACAENYVSKTVIRMHCKHARHVCRLMVSYTSPDGWSRRVYQGPVVPGPYAATFPLPTVIDNFGGSGREARENEAAGLEFDVVEGERLWMDGREWEIRDDVWLSYPTLYPVE